MADAEDQGQARRSALFRAFGPVILGFLLALALGMVSWQINWVQRLDDAVRQLTRRVEQLEQKHQDAGQ